MRLLNIRVSRHLMCILVELQFESLDDGVWVTYVLWSIQSCQDSAFLLFIHLERTRPVNISHNLVVLLPLVFHRLLIARQLQIIAHITAKLLRHAKEPLTWGSSVWKHWQLKFKLTQQANFDCLVLLKQVWVSSFANLKLFLWWRLFRVDKLRGCLRRSLLAFLVEQYRSLCIKSQVHALGKFSRGLNFRGSAV